MIKRGRPHAPSRCLFAGQTLGAEPAAANPTPWREGYASGEPVLLMPPHNRMMAPPERPRTVEASECRELHALPRPLSPPASAAMALRFG